ncbi:glycosyltransferase family 39 protein [Nostoc sp. UHCC 0302]|uniref:ArnT family glycosyltransferase n=1 Tax=Nostoc sp. UHCC 0302 TaxID=3134896 RepID=UPI00311CC1A7
MPKLKNIFFNLLIIAFLVCFVLAIRFKPITQAFELDYDEGLNLIKALLYSQGFSLYTEIWSDQPPLFTVLLSLWLSLFGQSVVAARLLVLIFSALLMWCFYQIIRRELGIIPALVATVFLLTSWLFIRISISVMIGIPSISLAMLSIYLITLYKQHDQKRFLILSGISLAISLQTKLFTIFLIPLILFYITDFKFNLVQENKHKRLLFNTFVFWLTPLLLLYTVILCAFQQFYNYKQIFQSHLNQPTELGLANFNNLNFILDMISQDYDYIFLSSIGILAIFWKKKINGLFPLTWLGTAILILFNYKPIWYHHYPLLAIPICWLAAYGVALLIDCFSQSWNRNLKLWNIKKLIFPSLVVGLLVVLIIATPPNTKGTPAKNLELMQLVLKHKSSTQWLFTDRPIYAFYAGLRVPPEIAVISYKRLNSGSLTTKDILAVLQNYRPEQIVLARWNSIIKGDNKIMDYIHENYSRTYINKEGTEEHYILSINNKNSKKLKLRN